MLSTAAAPTPSQSAPVAPSAPTSIEPEKPSVQGSNPPANDTGVTPGTEEQASQSQVTFDNWRELVAQGDEKVLNELNRLKSPGDIGKELLRQKGELSKRMASQPFPVSGTPEQQAEWRAANQIPKEATLEAYGIKAPENYNMTDAEKAGLGEMAKIAQQLNLPPKPVQEMANLLFKTNAAQAQAANEADRAKAQEWKQEYTATYGKDTDSYIKAATEYLTKDVFGGDEQTMQAFLGARLPGGGRIGDHPKMIDLVVGAALKAGYTDRIETQQMESNGRSLAMQQAEIEKLRFSNRAEYNDPRTQDRLKRIIELRLSNGEIDEMGNEKKRR